MADVFDFQDLVVSRTWRAAPRRRTALTRASSTLGRKGLVT